MMMIRVLSGYARQDRKMQARVPISAADVARLLEVGDGPRPACHDLDKGTGLIPRGCMHLT
jgi:hypothetical protein